MTSPESSHLASEHPAENDADNEAKLGYLPLPATMPLQTRRSGSASANSSGTQVISNGQPFSSGGSDVNSVLEVHPGSGSDVKDTRNTLTSFTVFIPESQKREANRSGDYTAVEGKSASRWSGWEFKLYLVAFIVVVPMMVAIPIRLSSPSNPNWWLYEHRLSPGWIPGRLIDNSDPQYRTFRSNLGSLLLLVSAHLSVSTSGRRFAPLSRLSLATATAVVLTIVLHGANAAKVFAILFGNYSITKIGIRIRKRTATPWISNLVIWTFNVGVLFANDWFEGYPFGAISTRLAWLDSYAGLLPRWHISFNVTMLRLISFSSDWAEATLMQPEGTRPTSNRPPTYRARVRTSLPLEEYNVRNLVAYALYPPLYIAGPIMTFNDFVWQQRHPPSITGKSRVSYAVRFLFSLLAMELVLHFMYVVAIKETKAWKGDSPSELSMIGFWNLIVVWLKLLLPWRFFRLWALLDGIDPPENMIRCMANNYSTMGFWKSWHRSYNLWVVRYVYIPLGGSRNRIMATLCVFTFVALWHDLSFRLLAWGWLISLFIIPEILAGYFLPESKYGKTLWYRHVCAVGGMLNVWMMMAANLVGFVVGTEGLQYLLESITGTVEGWCFLAFSCVCLFIGVQVMFEYREEEKRNGIHRQC